nr:transposase [Paenibacillus sp. E194]
MKRRRIRAVGSTNDRARECILQLKNNRGFRRFLLRGLSKVSLEVGWLSLIHNLLKWTTRKKKRSSSGRNITPNSTFSNLAIPHK